MSKAGVFAHFGSKEALQVAVVEHALERVQGRLFGPISELPPGVPRLRAFLHAYLADIADEETPGGCFFTAAGSEFDRRPGAVRDRLAGIQRSWYAFAAGDLRASQRARSGSADEGPPDADQVAFEVVALAQAASLAYQLLGAPEVLDRARHAVDRRLDAIEQRHAAAGSAPADPAA